MVKLSNCNFMVYLLQEYLILVIKPHIVLVRPFIVLIRSESRCCELSSLKDYGKKSFTLFICSIHCQTLSLLHSPHSVIS